MTRLLIVLIVVLVVAIVAGTILWLRKRRSGAVLLASSPDGPIETAQWPR